MGVVDATGGVVDESVEFKFKMLYHDSRGCDPRSNASHDASFHRSIEQSAQFEVSSTNIAELLAFRHHDHNNVAQQHHDDEGEVRPLGPVFITFY
jgi:hypothetical protein